MTRLLTAMGFLAALAGAAYASDRDKVIASCKAELGFKDSACECIAKEFDAMETKEQKMFIAMITENRPEMQKLQGEFTINEMQALGSQVEQMPGKCQGQ